MAVLIFPEENIGTEEAEELFQQGTDHSMDARTVSLFLPEDPETGFRTLFEDIYSKADCTVGDAEKQEDDTYVITVTYRPMKLFSLVETHLMEKVNNLTESCIKEAMSSGEQHSRNGNLNL